MTRTQDLIPSRRVRPSPRCFYSRCCCCCCCCRGSRPFSLWSSSYINPAPPSRPLFSFSPAPFGPRVFPLMLLTTVFFVLVFDGVLFDLSSLSLSFYLFSLCLLPSFLHPPNGRGEGGEREKGNAEGAHGGGGTRKRKEGGGKGPGCDEAKTTQLAHKEQGDPASLLPSPHPTPPPTPHTHAPPPPFPPPLPYTQSQPTRFSFSLGRVCFPPLPSLPPHPPAHESHQGGGDREREGGIKAN
jgi:hypothetical protein